MPALCHLTRMQMLSKEMHIQQCSNWVHIKCYINVVLKVLTNVKRLRVALNEKSDYIQYEQFHSGQISSSWNEYQSKPGNSSCWHVVRKISPSYNNYCFQAERLLCRAFIVQIKWNSVKGIIIHAEKRWNNVNRKTKDNLRKEVIVWNCGLKTSEARSSFSLVLSSIPPEFLVDMCWLIILSALGRTVLSAFGST